MRISAFLSLFICLSVSAIAQYRHDNVLYKTVDPAELCPTLEQHKGYVLLDVRSKGENSDTSTSLALNIGYLKGATNIDIRELGTRLTEIKAYKDQPVFVYCSHSQRSRRASKMLVDSGFTKVYNVNGGLTALYAVAAENRNCVGSLIATNNKYSILSPAEVCNRLSGKKKLFILDVRTDSAYRHISTDAKSNALGYLKSTVNIPAAEVENKLSLIPKDQDILVTDLYGGEAAKVASLLTRNGYTRVSVLLEGVSKWLSTDEKELPCKYQALQSPAGFHILSSGEFGRFTQSNDDYVFLDVRTAEEFANQSRDSWRNIGHLKNAINIPQAALKERIAELEKFKNKPIVVYAFSGASDAFAAARMLHEQGFKKVNVLNSGLFNIRWLAANDQSYAYLKELVTDVPEINW